VDLEGRGEGGGRSKPGVHVTGPAVPWPCKMAGRSHGLPDATAPKRAGGLAGRATSHPEAHPGLRRKSEILKHKGGGSWVAAAVCGTGVGGGLMPPPTFLLSSILHSTATHMPPSQMPRCGGVAGVRVLPADMVATYLLATRASHPPGVPEKNGPRGLVLAAVLVFQRKWRLFLMELRIGSPALPFAALHVLLQCVDIVAIGAAICAEAACACCSWHGPCVHRVRERRAGNFGGSFSFPKEVAPVLNGTSNCPPLCLDIGIAAAASC
jgi:hypothetical protein